jgi:hypothetical protein
MSGFIAGTAIAYGAGATTLTGLATGAMIGGAVGGSVSASKAASSQARAASEAAETNRKPPFALLKLRRRPLEKPQIYKLKPSVTPLRNKKEVFLPPVA